MGNKVLVSVFDTEQTAFEGLSVLKDLHRDGDITLYASAVIVKDRSGVVAVRQSAEKGPLGTLVGIVTGGLVGLIGGPAGAVVGASLGGFGGMTFDLFNAGAGVGIDDTDARGKPGVVTSFVEEVGGLLTPDKAAVIADVDETWVTPVDTRLQALGGTTFRRLPGEVIDEQLIRESIAAEQELRELQAEVRESSDEGKAKLKESIEAQKRKLEATSDRINNGIAEADADLEARLAALREQQGKAHERQQAREARIEELKASHEVRKAKLEDVRRLAIQSVEATREALVS